MTVAAQWSPHRDQGAVLVFFELLHLVPASFPAGLLHQLDLLTNSRDQDITAIRFQNWKIP